MKKHNFKINRVSLYNKLIKKGMQLNTLLEFNDKQLLTLATRLLKEEDPKSVILQRELEVQKRYEEDMAQINQEKANVMDTNEEALDPRFPAAKKYKDAEGNEEEILEDELDEDLFDDPDNAQYLDTPSFTNPDAEGFQSQGPMDSYGGDGEDEGFAGTLNVSETIGFTEPKYSFTNPKEKGHQSDGPMGNSSGIHEDDLEEGYEEDYFQKKLTGQTQLPPEDADDAVDDGMDDDTNPESRAHKAGMEGAIAETISKKELMEVASSKAQKRFWCFVKSCKESNYEDCGTGTRIKTTAKDSTMKEINDYCDTDDSKLPEKVSEGVNKQAVENWLLGLVEKYERPEMTKGELIKAINEIETTLITHTDPDVEDAGDELPAWMDFESLFSPGAPITTPVKTPTTTPTRPRRKTPYQPKHKPKPKAFRE